MFALQYQVPFFMNEREVETIMNIQGEEALNRMIEIISRRYTVLLHWRV